MQENDTENESLPLGPRLLLWGYKENIYRFMIYNTTVSVLKTSGELAQWFDQLLGYSNEANNFQEFRGRHGRKTGFVARRANSCD